MAKNNDYKCNLFTIVMNTNDNNLWIEFSQDKKQQAKNFEHLNYCSCLIHSFKPDQNSIWRKEKRLDYEIKGWSPNVAWTREDEYKFQGILKNVSDFNLKEFGDTLETALEQFLSGVFEIGSKSDWEKYQFKNKGREIVGLCVLYDLEPHRRDELEIRMEFQYQPYTFRKKNSQKKDTDIEKFYGDPSKVVDYLRNEGWTRDGDNPTLVVKREGKQQKYQLTTRKQDLLLQVSRANIKQKWKDELFKLHDNTCRICHTKYEDPKYLSPDHRIPAIIKAENLNDDNFTKKLMTLCIFCNQRKREFTKKVSPDYDWDLSPWAYPEEFQLEKIAEEIKGCAKLYKLTHQQVIDKILELISK